MLKLFREHPEFDEHTRLDTDTGRLETITQQEFERFLPPGFSADPALPLQRVEGNGATVFMGETPETHTRFPRRVYFQITRNCNLRCPACFIRAGRGGAHVPTAAALDMAAFMARSGLVEVRLTGGEPTTHPDFPAILRRFREEGVYVSVATNGVINRKTLDALSGEDNLWVICSVDGNRETHNAYRPGTFDVIVGNLKRLKARNPSIRIRLTCVLTKRNKDQMGDLGEICRFVDAESITVIPLRPEVRDPRMREEMVSAAEFQQVIESLIEASERFGIRFTTTLETDYKSKIYGDPVFRKRSSCAAGREGTNLDYDAARDEFLVYGCSYSPAVDLHADPAIRRPFLAGVFRPGNPEAFLDIWRDDSLWTVFRDLSVKSEDCGRCEYYKRHQCVGSCPIQNVDYTSIRADSDVLEQLREQITHTGEWYCYKKIIG